MAFLKYNGGYSHLKIPTNDVGTEPPDTLSPYIQCFIIYDVSAVGGEIVIDLDEVTYPYAHTWCTTVPRQLSGDPMYEAHAGPATAPAAVFYRPDLPNAQTGE